jgi:hypothetical protein
MVFKEWNGALIHNTHEPKEDSTEKVNRAKL